jgi:hypothetical protein
MAIHVDEPQAVRVEETPEGALAGKTPRALGRSGACEIFLNLRKQQEGRGPRVSIERGLRRERHAARGSQSRMSSALKP